jgi:hypothetical protein
MRGWMFHKDFTLPIYVKGAICSSNNIDTATVLVKRGGKEQEKCIHDQITDTAMDGRSDLSCYQHDTFDHVLRLYSVCLLLHFLMQLGLPTGAAV